MRRNIGEMWKEKFNKDKYAYKIKTNRFLWFLFCHQPLNKTIKKYCQVKKGTELLEPGCASGKLSLTMALYGANVTALDFSEQMLKNTNDLKKQVEGIYSKKLNMKIVNGDLTGLNFKDSSFDVVCNEGVVEHWLDKKERINVIKEMCRVTKLGGFVAIVVPNGKHPFYRRWVRLDYPGYSASPPMTLYSVEKLKNEMELAGLKIVYSDGFKPWTSLNHWPEYRLLSPIISFMNLFFPLTRKLREKWGPHIICIGKK